MGEFEMKKRNLLIVTIAILFLVGCSSNGRNISKTESGVDVPIVDIKNEDDKTEIARVVFEEYLKLTYENYLNDENERINILKDYKIRDISILENSNCRHKKNRGR